MNEKEIKEMYKELKRNKKIIGSIDVDFFFEFADAVLNLLEKKDKMIDEIQEEVLDHIGFENRLKRDNRKPNLFNQGRFYVANNINNILKGK